METTKVMKILSRHGELTWDYDEEADVLYVSIGKPRKAMGVDVGEGTVVRFDEAKNEVVGFTLIGFYERFMESLAKRRTRSKAHPMVRSHRSPVPA